MDEAISAGIGSDATVEWGGSDSPADLGILELDVECRDLKGSGDDELLLDQECPPALIVNGRYVRPTAPTDPCVKVFTGLKRPRPVRRAASVGLHFPEFTAQPAGLAGLLAGARCIAAAARGADDRSRQMLYRTIGCAYDFALAALAAPDEFARLAEAAGVKMQQRAPMTPMVKLVFGPDHDRTRLAEYAAVLTHAKRLNIPRGTLAQALLDQPGGIKSMVAAERGLRQPQMGQPQTERTGPRAAIARQLRALPRQRLEDLAAAGDEFGLVIVRRSGEGTIAVVGEVPRSIAMLERTARQLLGGR